MRLRGASSLTLASMFALWLGASGVTVVQAIRPSLWPIAVLVGFVGFFGLSRMSPLPLIGRLVERYDRARLLRSARVTVTARPGATTNFLILLIVGFATWVTAMCAGAYAMKNPGVGATLFASAAFVACAWGFARALFGRAPLTSLTLGRDGVATGERFIPYSAIVQASVGNERLVLELAAPGERLELAFSDEVGGLVRDELLRRREASKNVAVDPAPVERHAREADVPIAELVATMRDGAVPVEERVRIAQLLRISAPSEVDALAAETAEPELMKEGRASRP